MKHAVLKCGYRHIDTASAYENEEFIGDALQEFLVDGELMRMILIGIGTVVMGAASVARDHYELHAELFGELLGVVYQQLTRRRVVVLR